MILGVLLRETRIPLAEREVYSLSDSTASVAIV
jgi:hypothetical protein